jgi:hypothetical protein
MWKLDKANGRTYAWYNFSLDELYWLLAYLPENDDFKKTLWEGIKILEAEGEKKWKAT